jgi:hypothetical protein
MDGRRQFDREAKGRRGTTKSTLRFNGKRLRKEAELLADETFEKPFRKVHRQSPVLKFRLEDSITNFRFWDGQGRVTTSPIL